MANSTPVITTVRNTDGREKTPRETDTAPQASIQEFCEKHYDDILPIIMEKARQDKRKGAAPESEATSVVSKSLTARPTPPKGLGTESDPAMMATTGAQKEARVYDKRLAVPWTCEDVDPFTPRIRNFRSSQKTGMPNNVKTYDGTGDPEDHLKVFQAAAQVEHWAMPTWCHMFNSTLIGAARVWFDELPAESIDGYKDLKAAFLSYFMQQKKYVKDPV
ncbi:hypothetical protein Tco_0000568 [Tanacetum coccineum]